MRSRRCAESSVWLTFVILMLIGCGAGSSGSKPIEQSAIGKWSAMQGQETIDFQPNGTFVGNMERDTIEGKTVPAGGVTGTYFFNGNVVSVKLDGHDPMTWKAEMSGPDLIITFDQGGDLKMDRTMAKYKRAN